MKEIKTLANCTDREAIIQFNKARHLINEWCDATDIEKIRERVPELEIIPKGIDAEQERLIREKNTKLLREQSIKNLNAVLDAALEVNPDLTLKVIRVCCFKEPDDESMKFPELIHAVNDILSNEEIINFFIYSTNLAKSLGIKL